jgi:hypothetical protein
MGESSTEALLAWLRGEDERSLHPIIYIERRQHREGRDQAKGYPTKRVALETF